MTLIARFASLGIAAAAGALGVACTASSASGGGGGPALGDAAVGDSAVGEDAAPSLDAGDAAATGDGSVAIDGAADAPLVTLMVDVAQQLGSMPDFSVTAAFQLASPGCTALAPVGPCTAVRCTIAPDAGIVLPGGPSAGDITVTGAGTAKATLVYGVDGGQYSRAGGMAGFFAAGDTITLTAAGAAIAAFGPKTLVAPGDVAFTAPVCSGGDCPGIDRTFDMPVTWTEGPRARWRSRSRPRFRPSRPSSRACSTPRPAAERPHRSPGAARSGRRHERERRPDHVSPSSRRS